MIGWRNNQNVVGSAANAANAMAAAVFLGVDSMISMYSVLFSLIFFGSNDSCRYSQHFIGYIAITIHGHFKQGLSQLKCQGIVWVDFCVTKAISGFLPLQ
jgi:hypothetical protein